MHGRTEISVQDLGGESPKETDHSEGQGVDRRMDLREIGWGRVDWI
jgi:hypothetical protein